MILIDVLFFQGIQARFFTYLKGFLKIAISILNSIYKSNLSTCIINMENVEPFIFGDAFLNFVWFETFAQTPFFDF